MSNSFSPAKMNFHPRPQVCHPPPPPPPPPQPPPQTVDVSWHVELTDDYDGSVIDMTWPDSATNVTLPHGDTASGADPPETNWTAVVLIREAPATSTVEVTVQHETMGGPETVIYTATLPGWDRTTPFHAATNTWTGGSSPTGEFNVDISITP